MIERNLPVLVVLVPLVGGLLCLLQRSMRVAWGTATITHGVLAAAAWALFHQVAGSPDPVQYELGAWRAEYGIALRFDALNSLVVAIVASLSLLAVVSSAHSVRQEIPHDRHGLFFGVWLFSVCGLLGMTASGDAFNIYVLLEIASLTGYTLVAMGMSRDRRALTAALRYLVLGSIGATFLLLGIGYLLMLTGTLNLLDMREQLLLLRDSGALEENRTLLVAMAFLVVGIGLKMALWPFHVWLPDAYTYAPSSVATLLSSTATKVGAYLALRFLYTLLGGIYDPRAVLQTVVLCACLGVLFSSMRALRTDEVRRILAYSSVGQLGYIVIGLALPDGSGLRGSVLHIFNHAIIKGALFMAVGAVALRIGGTRLHDWYGLGRRMPWTAAAFTVAAIGLVGMPGTAGFLSKWYLLEAAAAHGDWMALVTLATGGLLALLYIGRVVEAMYLRPPANPEAPRCEAPLTMVVPMWILAIATLWFGIFADFSAGAADRAAQWLVSGTP